MPTCLSQLNPTITTPIEMDPATTKRVDYTVGLAEASLPADAAPEWLDYANKLRKLYTLLGNHEAMMPNLQQTFNTPANSKNSVYFLWDFIQRTLHMLYLGVPASMQNMSRAQQEQWQDVHGRSFMAAMLIVDDIPGMLKMMTESTYGNQGNWKMGDEVINAALTLAGPDYKKK